MPTGTAPRVVIVGAGIGGLAAALRLAVAGCAVTLCEAQSEVGGKMRTLPSVAGPVDAGPTVLTMRPVFEALFAECGLRLDDHLELHPLPVIARHYWDDGTCLDLLPGREDTAAEIARVFGSQSAEDYRRFAARAARLFAAFDAPMMRNPAPDTAALVRQVATRPRLLADMAPGRSLSGLLRGAFREPRLAQLYARYATYVGGIPGQTPALLSLIAEAEAQGVWAVKGGMHQLALTLADLARARGASILLDTPVRRITRQGGRAAGVETDTGHIAADAVLFNGDPRALHLGLLGEGLRGSIRADQVTPRSLSASVQAFAAAPAGPALAHHTVFFGAEPEAEFAALSRGEIPADATLYLCAQDHGTCAPDAVQRFEVIRNAPPVLRDAAKEKEQCQTLIFARFRAFGLTFSPTPGTDTLTTPSGFDRLFPGSQGSLYGRSPQGLMAGMKRPRARTPLPGLYLAGGGAHPGAGVPMATLSAGHAAAAIISDLSSMSMSPLTAMPGGTSTG